MSRTTSPASGARRVLILATSLILVLGCAVPPALAEPAVPAGIQRPQALSTSAPVRALEETDTAITGRVVGLSGLPVEGAAVIALVWSDTAKDFVQFTVPVHTNADGRYELHVLTGQTYKLRVSDPLGRGYAFQYMPDAPTAAEARDVTVTAGAPTEGVDATLGPGGTITGTLLDPMGRPLKGYETQTVYRYSDTLDRWLPVEAYESTGVVYRCDALLPGKYRLLLAPAAGTPYLRPFWYPGERYLYRSQDIEVLPGASVSLGQSRFIERIPGVLGLKMSRTVVPAGTLVKFSLVLRESLRGSRLRYRRVRVYQSNDGRRWSHVKTIRLGWSGSFTVPFVIRRAMYYRFHFAGERGVLPDTRTVIVRRL